MEAGRCTVAVGPRDAATDLVVSRRHTRELRELLGPARHVMTETRPPARVRVTGPPRRRHTPQARTGDIDEQTALGGVYLGSLLREQLALAVRILGLLVLTVGSLPLLFRVFPELAEVHVLWLPLAWLLLGLLVYPWLLLLGVRFVRRAERNERDFVLLLQVLDEDDDHMTMDGVPGLVALLVVSLATLAIGTYGLRISRTTSDFYVASRSVAPGLNASAIGGEYLSAASYLGVAALVLTAGAQMLWYPVGWTAGYLVLLVLVAAPLRRSGAYTLPDFAEARLGSRRVRALCSVLVVAIGWLYLLPQFQGAGLTLTAAVGAPTWVGALVVGVVVVVNVSSGGMRSITFVQAFQYWLKLTALLVPAAVLLVVWAGDGRPDPTGGGAGWSMPLGEGNQGLYTTYSIILATFLGTMGLPHVVVRFYTNPDGGPPAGPR